MRPECPAAPPTRLSRDQLEDRGQHPIASRSNSPGSLGQLEPDASLQAQEFVHFSQTVARADLLPERLSAARGPFVCERGGRGWQVPRDVPVSWIPVELRPEIPEAGALERRRVLFRRPEAQEQLQVIQVQVRTDWNVTGRQKLLRPEGDAPALPEQEERELSEVLPRQPGAEVSPKGRTQFRLGWPAVAGEDRVKARGDRVSDDGLQLVLGRTRLDGETRQNLPADRIAENVPGNAVEKQARLRGECLHQLRDPAVLPGLAVDQETPDQVVGHVLIHATGLHDRVPKRDGAGHLTVESAVKVGGLPLEDPAGDGFQLHPPMHKRREDAPAVEAAAQR